MNKYDLYRSMTLNGMSASHIVHYYKYKFNLNPVSFQEWPFQGKKGEVA